MGYAMRALLSLFAVLAVANAAAFKGTDKNFKSEVLGSGKNVFVKFLAPWWVIRVSACVEYTSAT